MGRKRMLALVVLGLMVTVFFNFWVAGFHLQGVVSTGRKDVWHA